MSRPNPNRRSHQRGFSLAEILVAMAVFTVVVLAALVVYDRSNKVFKQSVEASDVQQSTRVAFDRLVADVRMSGFDYDRDGTPFGSLASDWTALTNYTSGMLVQPTNPNGHTYICITGGKTAATQPTWPTTTDDTVTDGTVVWQENGNVQYQQPDEQIEYAGQYAIALRANFNYDTATGPCSTSDLTIPCENGREKKLETTVFPVVTTDNDEIVIYALKPVAWKTGESADNLVFYADTAIPRNANPQTDGEEDTITISGVDLCNNGGCNSPPYTLYRYTLDENGDPDAGTPVAENIRSMSFRYFDTTTASEADVLAAYPNGDGKYQGNAPNAVLAGRDNRATIRAIELTLTGMNSQPDPKYTDTTDTVAPHYRKVQLKSLIVPRNIGRRGMKEYNTTEPGAPTLKSVCTGACNAVYLTWKAPSTGGDIDSYAVLYDLQPCSDLEVTPGNYSGFQYSEEIGLNLEGSIGRYITPGQPYSFAVQAINKWGAKTSNCMDADVINTTTPAALTELHATNPLNAAPYGNVPNQIELYFPPAVSNTPATADLSCSGGGGVTESTMSPAEKRYYEIIRAVDDADFQPGDAGVVTVLDAGTATQPVDFDDLMKWVDTTVSNCTTYHYRIRVVDFCARDANYNSPADQNTGRSTYYPPLNQNAIPGRAETGIDPKPPTLTLKTKACAGMSNNCDLTFAWNPVTENTEDDPIDVGRYILRGYLWNGTAYNTDADMVQTITDGSNTATHHVNATEQWKFLLFALDCNESEPSNPLIFPCEFTGGDLEAGISSGGYDGSGTLLDPYVVEGATLTVTTDNPVSEVSVTLTYVDTGAQIGPTLTQTGPLSTANFTLPQTDDTELVKVLVIAKDSGGCTKNDEIWLIDEQAPACSLTSTGIKPSLLTKPSNRVLLFKLENVSTEALTLLNVGVTFTTGGNQKLNTVSFNGGAEVTSNCAVGTARVAPATTQTITANNVASPYTVQLTFDKNVDVNTTVTSMCVTYRSSGGDVVSCQMHPTAVACTAPAGACQ